MAIDSVPAEDRTRFADALRALSQTLRGFAEATVDYQRLLSVVADTLAEVVGDGCVVRLLGDGGWLAPEALCLPLDHLADADTVARVHAHVMQPQHIDTQLGAKHVLETGAALLVPKLDLQRLRE